MIDIVFMEECSCHLRNYLPFTVVSRVFITKKTPSDLIKFLEEMRYTSVFINSHISIDDVY